MYALGFTLFNVGELVGALGTGLLVQFIPYSYISFIGLVIHILSYILYGMASQGWMLLLSRPISGLFIGSSLALAPTYFSETHELYLAALRQHGEEPEKRKRVQIKDVLYAFHALVMAGGFLLGTGEHLLVDCDRVGGGAWIIAVPVPPWEIPKKYCVCKAVHASLPLTLLRDSSPLPPWMILLDRYMRKCCSHSTGATVVFAQFPISQFRAIAWFNVAVGLLFILLQLILFRGESKCTKLPHFSFRCWSVRCTWSSITCIDIVVSLKLEIVWLCNYHTIWVQLQKKWSRPEIETRIGI